VRKLKISLQRRQKALDQIAEGKKSPYDIAAELDITPQAVYRWLEVAKRPKADGLEDVTRRLDRVEKDIDYLKQDLTHLKKTLEKLSKT
jgi:predicted transcriptional regulator